MDTSSSVFGVCAERGCGCRRGAGSERDTAAAVPRKTDVRTPDLDLGGLSLGLPAGVCGVRKE